MTASNENRASIPDSTGNRTDVLSDMLASTHTLSSFVSKCATWPFQVPILAFPRTEDAYADFELFTAKEINDLADRTASHLISQGLKQLSKEESLTIALLCPATTEYVATFLALVKLGYTIFLMSPRLSAPTIAALLAKTGCNLVIHTPGMITKLEEVPGQRMSKALPLISREELRRAGTHAQATMYDTSNWANDTKIALIWHSSGSTGIPKVFPMTHSAVMARLRSTCTGPYAGKPLFITSSVYNSAGSTFMLAALLNSAVTYYFNDFLPYTAEGLTQVLMEARPHTVIIVPYALKQVATTLAGMKALKACNSVNSFGAVCPTQLGDMLVGQGVVLSSGYAMSETSTLMTSAIRQAETDKGWDYLAPYPFTKAHIWMKPLGADLYECVILSGLANCPTSNSNDPPGSFHTSDVFIKHPTLPNRWKLIGRQDDVINMSFSESFVALPSEDHMKQHPLVDEAVVFGNGRPKLGLLVFCSEKAATLSEEELIAQIWPTVEEMNAQNRPWTQISPDMIIAIPFGQNWPRTDKQNIIRPQAYRQYEDLINAKYDEMDEYSIVEPHQG